jgi:hypothetical protein
MKFQQKMSEGHFNQDVHYKYNKSMFHFEICHPEVGKKQRLPPNLEEKQQMLQQSLTQNQFNNM